MAWLHAYKHAWQERDVDAALALFTDDASYRERRFGEPLLGHKTLESYWRDRVFEHQRDIAFDFQLWGVKGNELMARWQASFIWLPINGLMRMDGVMHVTFAGRRNGRLIGSDYSEWFDHTEK
ncbi:MAG: nuclear transport factor 2 family protein [Alphaproteobacteria bacterium]|nr:nuclear transport factor 2 family protein [Alphaproteobacteria bacterium]